MKLALAIARELKAIRIRKDLRMEDVANDNDMALETLRRYEKNAGKVNIETLDKILSYYNVDKSIFFATICEYNHEKEE